MKTTWLYGNHKDLGWGAIESRIDASTYITLDFEPEFECRNDVRQYWKNKCNLCNGSGSYKGVIPPGKTIRIKCSCKNKGKK